MIEYKIVTGNGNHQLKDNLEQSVDKLMKSGWRCQGGVSITFTPGNAARYAQAMVHGEMSVNEREQ